MKILPVLLTAALFAEAAGAAEAPRKEKEVDVGTLRQNFPNLMPVRRFSTVDVVILGNKSRLGIKEQELKEFVELCYKQLFRGYDFEPATLGAGGEPTESGTINLLLESFPIALSVELRMGSLGSEKTWKTNELRVATNNSIRDARLIKTSVATMMAKAATTLRRMQSKDTAPPAPAAAP